MDLTISSRPARLTYEEAEQLFNTARDKRTGKPIGTHTRLHKDRDYRRDGTKWEDCPRCYTVRYHETNVVTIREDGLYRLDSGGWRTRTTMARIEEYAPVRISGAVKPYLDSPNARPWTVRRPVTAPDYWDDGAPVVEFEDGMLVDSDGNLVELPWERY